MTRRNQVMDKYWLEFLEDKANNLYNDYGRQIEETFWEWFYKEKVVKRSLGVLEDYLK